MAPQIQIRFVGPELLAEFSAPIFATFGAAIAPDRIERLRALPELDTRIAAYDGADVVGSAGSFSFDLSTTGGRSCSTAGLTMVAVQPTHRRMGVLRSMMRAHLDDARARAKPIAALWASEGSIYGRYGYGLASFAAQVSIERNHSAFVGQNPRAEVRLVDEATAIEIMPTIWEQARRIAPGMPSRSPVWWQQRRFLDNESTRRGAGQLQRVVFFVDGRPEAYALYRVQFSFDDAQLPAGTAIVSEVIGATPKGTRAAMRFLCDLDLVTRIKILNLPVDHPIFLLMQEPRRLHATIGDALWVRVVDVCEALATRSYSSREALVFELEDEFCPWNTGRYRLDAEQSLAQKTTEPAELSLSASALGAAFLGGISFARLEEIGDVVEKIPGAIERADRIFRAARAPFCPEVF